MPIELILVPGAAKALDKAVVVETIDKFECVRLEGTFREVGGRYLELFRSSHMAAALWHEDYILPVWEKLGFPGPNFTVKGNPNRVYTAEQVQTANVLYRHFSGDKRTIREENRTMFFLSLRSMIYDPRLRANPREGTVQIGGEVVLDRRKADNG